MDIDIQVLDDQWAKSFKNLDQIIETSVKAALSEFTLPLGGPMEVSVQCANDNHIQALNNDYREKDKPTNVLSFPGLDWKTPGKVLETKLFEGQEALLGDIVLSIETIISEAKEQNKKPDDHLTHLTIHSVLHLLGFDHVDDDEAEVMEHLEITIMKKLGLSNPY